MADTMRQSEPTRHRGWRFAVRALAGVMIAAAVAAAWAHGAYVGKSESFPYHTLRRTVHAIKDVPWINSMFEGSRYGLARTRDASGEDVEQLAELAALGYVDGYEPAGPLIGVTTHVPELTYPGANLVVSAHAAAAELIDAEGRTLHSWSTTFAEAFPELPAVPGEAHQQFFRRALLLEDGDLLGIFEGIGMVRLDAESNVEWARADGAHHHAAVDGAGNIVVLTRTMHRIPRIHRDADVLEDFVTTVSPEGERIDQLSLLEAVEASRYAPLLDFAPRYGDIFHTNTVAVLDGAHVERSPAFAAGNLLVSFFSLNTIAIVDPRQRKVVWALNGQWVTQHQPTMLDNGNMLLFDNRGHHGMSKVIEFDPLTQEIVWGYYGTEANGFHSATNGSAQRLPNGNTLVTESNAGHAFELTPDKRIVWEFYNPARAGEEDELVATLCEVVRIERDRLDWLLGPSPKPEAEPEPASEEPAADAP